MKEKVREIMEKTKAEQVQKHGQLDDRCTYNAVSLFQNLTAAGFEADVIRGGLDMKDRRTPETPEDLAETGTGHWWVEVSINESSYTADIYAIGPDFNGEMILQQGVPDSYIPMTRNPEDMIMMFS